MKSELIKQLNEFSGDFEVLMLVEASYRTIENVVMDEVQIGPVTVDTYIVLREEKE